MSDYSEMLEKQKYLGKRELFAAMAMQGIVSTYSICRAEFQETTAITAVQYADALIAELERTQSIEKRDSCL